MDKFQRNLKQNAEHNFDKVIWHSMGNTINSILWGDMMGDIAQQLGFEITLLANEININDDW